MEHFTETDSKYIHKYGFRRFYDDIPGKVVGSETFAVLIEVALIELKKLKPDNSVDEKMLKTLFYNTPDVINMIEQTENVELVKVRKGVEGMLNYNVGREDGLEEGREDGRKVGLEEGRQEECFNNAKSFVELLVSDGCENYEIAIDKVAKTLNIDSKVISKLREQYGVY